MEQPTSPSNAPVRAKKRSGCLTGIFVIVALGVLGVAGYVATGPYRTLATLRRALTQSDSALLAQCVDFPVLRQNLKTQLMARANSGVNAIVPSGILSQIAGGIAGTVIDTTVDTFVTPAGLNRLLAGATLAANAAASAGSDSPPNQLENAKGTFDSIDTFSVTVPATSTNVVIELSRRGLDWQVTNVLLPPTNP